MVLPWHPFKRSLIINESSNHDPIRSEFWNGIHPRYFTLATWTPHLESHAGRARLARFVRDVLRRVVLDACRPREVEWFADLLKQVWGGEVAVVLKVVVRQCEYGRSMLGCTGQFAKLVMLMKPFLAQVRRQGTFHRKDDEGEEKSMIDIRPSKSDWDTGLSEKGVTTLRNILFDRQVNANHLYDNQQRIFDSTIEMAYPSCAIRHTIQKQHAIGQCLRSDMLGFPSALHLPKRKERWEVDWQQQQQQRHNDFEQSASESKHYTSLWIARGQGCDIQSMAESIYPRPSRLSTLMANLQGFDQIGQYTEREEECCMNKAEGCLPIAKSPILRFRVTHPGHVKDEQSEVSKAEYCKNEHQEDIGTIAEEPLVDADECPLPTTELWAPIPRKAVPLRIRALNRSAQNINIGS